MGSDGLNYTISNWILQNRSKNLPIRMSKQLVNRLDYKTIKEKNMENRKLFLRGC